MSRLQWLCLVAFLIFTGGEANALEAVASYTIFHRTARNGSDSAVVEISWQITNNSIHYRKNTDGELSSEIQTVLTIGNDTGSRIRERYVLQTPPRLPAQASTQKLIDMRHYYLPPGKWNIKLILGESAFQKDLFTYQDSIIIEPVSRPAFSNIQLLDTFFASTVPSPILKNGYQQFPLPLNFLDEGRRQLHFYTELYTDPATFTPGKLLIRYFYLSRRPFELPYFGLQLIDTVKDGAPLHSTLHTFDVGRVPSGNYYLNGLLKDTAGNRLASTSAFFQIVNKKPDPMPVSTGDTSKHNLEAGKSNYFNLGGTFVSKFTPVQLRAILRMILPQADPVEASTIDNFFKRPDEMYTRYFIYNYFGKFNKLHPEQAWKEFSEIVKEVNRDFNAAGMMGYETERGRVYLRYGKPDERIRVPSEGGAMPYEIWRYNAIGNTSQVGLFLFYQPGSSMGDYRILHSTAPGEYYNPTWKGTLYLNGQPSGNGNSRAEQYFEGK